MEIRDKVSQYVKGRGVALRREHPGQYENISCIRTNSMKYLPNFFRKGQLTKLFFLFPDPHFKTANHRRRIIQRSLLAEYAYPPMRWSSRSSGVWPLKTLIVRRSTILL